MRCPVCGSERLAWSGESGYLVCQDCGAVISELIDDGPPATDDLPVRRRPQSAPPPAVTPLEEAVEEASRRAVARGRVLVVVGRSVRLAPPLARTPKGIEPLLEVMRDFPDLRSRTERVRAAIAVYAALRAMGLSRARATELASRTTGASPRSLAKVLERHRRSVEGYERAVAGAIAGQGEGGRRTSLVIQALLGASEAGRGRTWDGVSPVTSGRGAQTVNALLAPGRSGRGPGVSGEEDIHPHIR